MSNKFSSKFIDSQLQKILQMLKKFTLAGSWSSKRGKKKVHKSRADPSQVEYFFYEKLGHWRRNYPQILDRNKLKKMSN